MRCDFLQDCWWSKTALKPNSSTTRYCWDDWGGVANLKRLSSFTGHRLTLLFLDFPEETRWLVGPGKLMEGTLTETCITRASSTILEILTPERDAESSEDGLMPPTAYHCSCESLTALRRSTARVKQAQISATTCERHAVSTWLQDSIPALLVMLSQIAADSANIAITELEKKVLCMKCGLLKNTCRQNTAPGTSSLAVITRSRLMMNFSSEVTGLRTKRAVSWNTWKKQDNSLTTRTIERLYLIGHNI